MSTPLEINTINLSNIDDFFTIPSLDNSINIVKSTVIHYDGNMSNNLTKIHHYNNVYILQYSDQYYYSTDLQTFTRISSLSELYYYGEFIYHNNLWMFYSSDAGYCAYSTDGLNWTQTFLDGNVSYITYGNNLWVSVGYNNTYYSSDGMNWVQGTINQCQDDIDNGEWYPYGVTYHNGAFYTSSYYGVYKSTDGITWNCTYESSLSSNRIQSVGNYLYLYEDNYGNILYSSDGENWNIIALFEEMWNNITFIYRNGIYYGQQDRCYSLDGIIWNYLDIDTSFIDIIYLNNICYGLGYNGLYQSQDGINFSLLLSTGTCNNLQYINNQYYLNTNGTYSDTYENDFWISTDGLTWSSMTIDDYHAEGTYDTIIHNNNLYVAGYYNLYQCVNILDYIN